MIHETHPQDTMEEEEQGHGQQCPPVFAGIWQRCFADHNVMQIWH